jgi:hypothetical protein
LRDIHKKIYIESNDEFGNVNLVSLSSSSESDLQLIPQGYGFVLEADKIIARHPDHESNIVCEKIYGTNNNRTALKHAVMEWNEFMQGGIYQIIW